VFDKDVFTKELIKSSRSFFLYSLLSFKRLISSSELSTAGAVF